ncbi:phage major capsid protein [Clostridium perfringens]|uniref:phage major capsid protein n=1 Tax=Clostridium perfringens TaxID=1502 RepID=UPI0021488D17|nr:phage major capsid protein [Clostridium perfringens]MDH5073648.1 Phage capsid family protein [Clostridium perfringens]MDK0623530.1 phage major capsid protein [Clostridium perfringens]MDK0759315.1 phage major capsid protein [Clostridium perfringens]MDM0846273.1 phage major capsid protein [Clostridium perfringens]MDM0854656.1 phage major capsid protein [Clostridium perfringens]
MRKELLEKRNALIGEMEGIKDKAKEEKRAFEENENTRMAEIVAEIKGIDSTAKLEEETRNLELKDGVIDMEEKREKTVEEIKNEEIRSLEKFIKGDERALGVANNGGIIPTSIASKIIEKVKELSPIYSMCTIYNVGGDLVFPVYDETSSSISATYVEDFAELTEGTGKFITVKLQDYIVGCLAKISKSLINRSDFDLVGFVVNKVAQAIADFLEKELITGTTKIKGLASNKNVVTSATTGKIGSDDIIDLMMEVPEVFQENACFIMHKNTLKALRKLKDADGDYILQKDIREGFGWSLFGKKVFTTESMQEVATGNKAIHYGDMSGLYVKLTKNIELQMLMEKYATQFAVGACAYIECDAAIVEPQKIATLTVK